MCAGPVLRVAAISNDDEFRVQLARAFDAAPSTWRVTLHDTEPENADVVVCAPDRDIPGAIPFDPDRPHEMVAAIEKATCTADGATIFVLGATGGCGATSVALHLAAIGKACVVEAHPPSIRRRLDLATARSWVPAQEDEAIELAAVPVAPSLRVLLAPGEQELDVDGVLTRARRAFADVVVDGGANRGRDLDLRRAIAVLVVPPTRPGAERAAEFLNQHPQTRWAIVTNRLGPGGGLTRRRIESILGKKVAVELPCSPALRDAEDEGNLLTSSFSPWLWQVKRLWRALQTA